MQQSDHWHIDGTFYVVPEKFYQLLIILIYEEATDLYIPGCFVLCSHKSKDIYKLIFKEVAQVILQGLYRVERITIDFESAEIEAIKEVFPKIELIGCKFHFQQALFRKAKKKGLITERLEKETKGIISNINKILESGTGYFTKYIDELLCQFSNKSLEDYENIGKIVCYLVNKF